MLGPTDCEVLVSQSTGAVFQATPETLRPLPLRFLVVRMLTNLKAIYVHTEDFPRAVRTIGRLRQLSPEDISLRRELGISLVHAGQPGRAVEHLEAYLHGVSDNEDKAQAQAFLNQALAEVGRWN